MTQEQLRMQMLAGIITEGQYNDSNHILRAYEIAEEISFIPGKNYYIFK